MSDEPSAFPYAAVYGSDGIGLIEGSPGMTLRDWFAGHAPEPPVTWWGMRGDKTCFGYAMWNYQYADAMLAQRS